MLVAGGGLASPVKFNRTHDDHFFCPEGKIAGAFRELFLKGLKALRKAETLVYTGSAEQYRNSYTWEEMLTKLYHIRWNAFVKETFNGNGNAITYLSRYAYRTAISNSRVLSVTAEGVTISYKDYDDGCKVKTMQLDGEEFVRRFLMHVLPKRLQPDPLQRLSRECLPKEKHQAYSEADCNCRADKPAFRHESP